MHDRPAHPTLLDAVAEFLLTHVSPKLDADKALQFRVLIAANVAQVTARELESFDARAAAEAAGLAALLPGHPAHAAFASGTASQRQAALRELNQALARRLRDGTLAVDAPGLREHLLAVAQATLAVTNPRFDTTV